MNFTKTDKKEMSNVFELIGNKWMLITAKKDGKINTMTASWGGMGVMWNKPVAICVIRPQRYTKEFIDASGYFTLSFLPEQYKKEMNYLGSKSGRDCDKIKDTGLNTVEYENNTAYFEESDLVAVCKKIYVQEMNSNGFIDEKIASFYPSKDYHTMYFGEITDVLKK